MCSFLKLCKKLMQHILSVYTCPKNNVCFLIVQKLISTQINANKEYRLRRHFDMKVIFVCTRVAETYKKETTLRKNRAEALADL